MTRSGAAHSLEVTVRDVKPEKRTERKMIPMARPIDHVLAVVLLAVSAWCLGNPLGASGQGACGPPDVRFDAHTAAGQPPAQPEPGKALVIVAEDFRKAPNELGNPTIRVGLDGTWMGAIRANSYLFFAVDPGEHHLCTHWQSHLERLSRLAAFGHLMAEPGKTYYFRARITYSGVGYGAANMNLDLERIDSDEGQFLVSSYRLSVSHPKK
jgi:hypothetical protein